MTRELNGDIRELYPLLLSFLIIILCCLPSSSGAAFEDLEVGARPLGLGGAYVGLADDVNAILYNPAGVSQIAGLQVTLFYARPYGLGDLSHGYVAVVRSTRVGVLGFGMKTLGGDLYRENTLVVSYARAFGARLMAGANLRHLNLSIEGYGGATSFGLDLGLLARLCPGLSWGSFVRNLNHPRIGQSSEDLPQTLATGLSVHPRHDIAVVFDVYKDIRHTMQVKAGIEYLFLASVDLRVGVQTEPARFTLGLGLSWRCLGMDYALWSHQELGFSHQISLNFSPGKGSISEALEFRDLLHLEREEKADDDHIEGEAVVDLNVATVEEMQMLPGVGPTLARRIVAHREEIGPFETGGELLDVKGITPGLLMKLLGRVRPEITREDVFLDVDEKIDINTADLQRLQRLPGIGHKTAERILNYREVNGPFLCPEALLNINGIGPALLEKIADRITLGEGDGAHMPPDSSENESSTKVNINVCKVDDLVRLPGIGEVLARRIIAHREEHGEFRRAEDLLAVPGIGEKLFEKIKGQVIVSEEER